MELDAIVRGINAEIEILKQVRALLTGHAVPLKRKRRPMSAESRARMAAAAKARWAKAKKSTG